VRRTDDTRQDESTSEDSMSDAWDAHGDGLPRRTAISWMGDIVTKRARRSDGICLAVPPSAVRAW